MTRLDLTHLLNDSRLECSPTVANSCMNRERRASGGNSYEKELSFNPIEFLEQRLRSRETIAWLDLCCGSGGALIDAATHFGSLGLGSRVSLVGIDLVRMFAGHDGLAGLRLVECPALDWTPVHVYDLITCVHGMHYIGDKLRLLQLASSWLAGDGLFLANLDPCNLRFEDGRSAARTIIRGLRKRGFLFNPRRHLIRLTGKKQIDLPYSYRGADDKAGPNYTGQTAVTSYYSQSTDSRIR
jgi:SAM-dependent methyltransferase